MTGMPELIALLHSFVGLAAVLVGWNGALETSDLSGALLDIHHAEVFIGVFIGGVTFTGSIVAFLKLSARMSSSAAHASRQERAQPRGARHVRRAHGLVRHRPGAVAARRGDHARAAARLAPGRVDRRRRHARGHLDAEQLLGLGGCRCGLPARQRPAHRHRCARRLLGCLPVVHHVQGDEPLVHLGDRRWIRHRRAHLERRRRGRACARSAPKRPPNCCATPRP